MKSATIFISLLGHITVFSIFSLTLGNRIPPVNFANVSFFGAILNNADLNRSFNGQDMKVMRKSEILTKALAGRHYQLISRDYLKPPANSVFNVVKRSFRDSPISDSSILKRKEPVIMFYPRLPYQFSLYFKDRQTVHIELMFNITPNKDKKNSITLKRKISSGNLEADLLSMRYISRYLFIQQMGFIPNNWQTVKIDLSAKND